MQVKPSRCSSEHKHLRFEVPVRFHTRVRPKTRTHTTRRIMSTCVVARGAGVVASKTWNLPRGAKRHHSSSVVVKPRSIRISAAADTSSKRMVTIEEAAGQVYPSNLRCALQVSRDAAAKQNK